MNQLSPIDSYGRFKIRDITLDSIKKSILIHADELKRFPGQSKAINALIDIYCQIDEFQINQELDKLEKNNAEHP